MSKARSNEPARQTKARVLVVENDLRTADLHKQNLERWGYTPVLAEGVGQELLDDAQRKAHEYACHIALVDMHLIDDYDESDKSGLDLAPKLKPALSIIVSGSGNDRATVLEAMKKEAIDFVGKEEPLSRLQDALTSAAVKMFCGSYGPKVIIRPNLVNYIMNTLAPERPEQVRELLKALFPDAHKIHAEEMNGSARTPSLSSRRRSIVIRVMIDDRQPVVVKLSPRSQGGDSKVKQEWQNYKNFVEDRIPNHYYARIRTSQQRWHLSGIVYDFLGDSQENFRPFTNYYRNESEKNIQSALHHLFDETWGTRYRITRRPSPSTQSLYDLFTEIWGKRKWKKEVLTYLRQKPKSFEVTWSPKPLNDPVHWVYDHVKNGKNPEEDRSYFPNVEVSVTHGDLLGDNFFVDKENKSWTIDYERTGFGPILQDFVQLELDILVRIANFERSELHDFLILLTTLFPDKTWLPTQPLGTNSHIASKCSAVIQTIRTLANEFLPANLDWRVYYWGVLLNAAFRTILLEEKIKRVNQANQAELVHEQNLTCTVGALIGWRLENWDKEWPTTQLDVQASHHHKGTPKAIDMASAEKGTELIKILFLAANPCDTERLRCDEEMRVIDEALQKSNLRDRFLLLPHFAVKPEDLPQLLLRHQPSIVHFSGHGRSTGEIVLNNETGQARAVPAEALSRLFIILRDNVRCVVLNACFSLLQVRSIAEQIDTVVGMSAAIGDEAALKFSTGFYLGLGNGKSVYDAFELGKSMIDLNGISEENRPILIADRIDPHTTYLY
jgi:ActR/RegA family two-component response regulator/thiamine kinase-like enzyme